MSFGTTGGAEAPWGGPWPSTKWELGRLLSLSLGFVFLRGGDRLGLSIADGSSSQSSPLLSGQRQLLQLADRILDRPPNGSGDLHAVLRTLAFGPRRNLLVVVSDLLLEDSILPLLEQHRAAGAEVWVFHLVDPAEIEFPYEEPTRFVDLETSAEAGLNPRDFARTYRAEFGAFLERQEEECRRGGIHYRRIRGDDRFDEILVEFLSR